MSGESIEFKVKSLKYLVKRLRRIESEIQVTVDKERRKKGAKVEWMNEYKTYDDAQEAYGIGAITQAEYEAVLDALDRGETYVESETPKSAALQELHNYISALSNDIRGYEWQMKSPEEQDDILRSNEAFWSKHGSGRQDN